MYNTNKAAHLVCHLTMDDVREAIYKWTEEHYNLDMNQFKRVNAQIEIYDGVPGPQGAHVEFESQGT